MADESGGLSTPPGFAELIGAMPMAVLLLGPDGVLHYANAAAERLLNQSERAMLGATLAQVMDLPEDYARPRAGRGFAAFDSELQARRGGRMRVDFAETPVPDQPGWRLVTMAETAARRIAAPSGGGPRAAIGAAAMLAHEIKNPLSGIRGAAQLLQGAVAGEEGALAALIVREVDRVAALIDRMEGFTDTRPLMPEALNIYPLLDDVRRVALAGFARGVRFEERFDPSLPPVQADRGALVQVVLNLVKNAAEATAGQADRRVMLATAYRHGMAASVARGRPRQPLPIELSVIDNGPGAPADIVDHLFDPFVSGKPEGQGLGLALVDKLMRDMGGITQYAREGGQTVFRLLLPRAG